MLRIPAEAGGQPTLSASCSVTDLVLDEDGDGARLTARGQRGGRENLLDQFGERLRARQEVQPGGLDDTLLGFSLNSAVIRMELQDVDSPGCGGQQLG